MKTLFTKITEVNLSALVYGLFYEDFFPIVEINIQHCILAPTDGEKFSGNSL